MTVIERAIHQGCGCDAPEVVRTLTSIDDALRCISDLGTVVAGVEQIPLEAAVGRVLAAPIRAGSDIPRFDNAAMDGYAIDAAALKGAGPWTLRVTSRVPAGHMPGTSVVGMTAARVFTGAPVPDGADAVIMQEEIDREGDRIVLNERPRPGQHIRHAGSEMATGRIVVEAGRILGPREVAACAAAGAGAVSARRRIRVGILATGDEVRRTGSGLAGSLIWDVNTPMLSAALTAPGVELVRVASVADNRGGLQRRLADAMGKIDLLVTTGGISVGEEDHVKAALAEVGAEILFSGVAIKPGKPVSFGRIGPTFWLGLPGNPLSAFVTWQLFGTALLRQLAGQVVAGQQKRHVVIGQRIHRKAGRCELRAARLAGFDAQGREVVMFQNATHSARVGHLPEADGLMFLPADADILPEGALVEFQPFCDM